MFLSRFARDLPGFNVIFKRGLRFLFLPQFRWCPPTHQEFISKRLFAFAEEELRALRLDRLLVPMTMLSNEHVLLKCHLPQPELSVGAVNPQATSRRVWTVSVKDDIPPEVLKIGLRKTGKLVVMPWNPSATDVCITKDEIDDWISIKNRDFSESHFILTDR